MGDEVQKAPSMNRRSLLRREYREFFKSPVREVIAPVATGELCPVRRGADTHAEKVGHDRGGYGRCQVREASLPVVVARNAESPKSFRKW
jgi:hypothetical protein